MMWFEYVSCEVGLISNFEAGTFFSAVDSFLLACVHVG